MYIYIVKFKNHKNAFKIGKANEIQTRLNKLSKTHGDVIYLRYIKCKDENISLNIEAIIHNTFNRRESLGFEFNNSDSHVIRGDGSSEFFIADSVIDRLDFIEDYIEDFGYELKCAKIQKNKLIDITLEELYELELDYYLWYVDNVHWGKMQNKTHKNYKIDKSISQRLEEDQKIRKECISEYIRIEKEMREVYSHKLKFANQYMPEKVGKFDLSKKMQFAENYYNFISSLETMRKDGADIDRAMVAFRVEEEILGKIKKDKFIFLPRTEEFNQVMERLYKEYKEIK